MAFAVSTTELILTATGDVFEVPDQDIVPPTARVKSYAVGERDGWVWLWIGQYEPKPIPAISNLPYFDDSDWAGTL